MRDTTTVLYRPQHFTESCIALCTSPHFAGLHTLLNTVLHTILYCLVYSNAMYWTMYFTLYRSTFHWTVHYYVQCLLIQYAKKEIAYYTALHCTVLHTVQQLTAYCTSLHCAETDFIVYACNVAVWSLWWIRLAFHYCLMLIHQHRSQHNDTFSKYI